MKAMWVVHDSFRRPLCVTRGNAQNFDLVSRKAFSVCMKKIVLESGGLIQEHPQILC